MVAVIATTAFAEEKETDWLKDTSITTGALKSDELELTVHEATIGE